MIKIQNILDVPKYLSEIDAAIFDLDDTLYSEKEYIKSGYRAIENKCGEIENMAQKLWIAFEENKIPIDTVLKNENVFSIQKRDEYLNVYRANFPDIHLYSGVPEMLKNIRSQGIKIGIITDGRPDGQRLKLKALGLYDLVKNIIITDELGGETFRKPNETAYRIICEKLNVPFNRTVYIGDNPNKDFIAPEKLGMKSIFFCNPDGLYSQNVLNQEETK